jgi:uncharacterized protein
VTSQLVRLRTKAAAGKPATRKAARRPDVPIDSYIVKVASRCNLDCTYCYVYNKGDESFRRQPFRMKPATVSALLSRVATHCAERKLKTVSFIFHGGEPLLAGMDFFRGFVAEAAATLGARTKPLFSLETNGTLLTREWLDLFVELQIAFGVSLDGPPEMHDRNRVDHAGAGSYARVRRALDLVQADRRVDRLFGGVLTVIDLETNPLAVYRHLREIGVRRCDFLLPDGTHDNRPAGLPPGGDATPYADWLIAIFDEWFQNEDTTLSIRILQDVIKLLFARDQGTDALGGGRNGVLVIETDGGIEPVDVLKICGDSFTKLGLNVATHEIRDAYGSDLVQLYQQGAARLCRACRACPIVAVCGGGYLPHRYARASGFDNPSVFCRDLVKLITHVRTAVLATIPQKLLRKLGMQPLSYDEVLALQRGTV